MRAVRGAGSILWSSRGPWLSLYILADPEMGQRNERRFSMEIAPFVPMTKARQMERLLKMPFYFFRMAVKGWFYSFPFHAHFKKVTSMEI